MSHQRLLDLQKLFPEGRRVSLSPKSAEACAKIPDGVTEGVVQRVTLLPSQSEVPDRESIATERFGLQIEIVLSSGETETIILDVTDVMPHETS